MRNAKFLALLVLLTSTVASQSTNDAQGRLTFNTIDGAAPNTVNVVTPTLVTMEITGAPNQPFFLVRGDSLSVGALTVGSESVDVDLASFEIILNGVTGTTFFDLFANTGSTGTATFNLPLPILGAGSLGAYQAAVFDTSLPMPTLFLTAASELVSVIPCDFGQVSYSTGTTNAVLSAFHADGASGAVTPAVPAGPFDMENLALNRHTQFTGNLVHPGNLDRFLAPTAARPLYTEANSSYHHLITIHGELYCFEDASVSPSQFGYMLSTGGAAPNVVLTDTLVLNGTSTASPFEEEVSISPDSSTMAVVYDPSSGNDQVFLIRLDGGTFALNGMGMIDVTPVGAGTSIPEESFRWIGNKLYFVDGSALGSGGVLHSVDQDPIGVATPVAGIPNTGTGMPVTQIDGEIFNHEPTGDLYFQGGPSTAEEDLYRIDAISGVVTNISNFTTATQIEEFGDGYDGSDGQFAVSPSGATCAFITIVAFDDELNIVATNGFGTPMVVSDTTRFETAIDDIIDLNMWSDFDCLFFAGVSSGAMDLYNFNSASGVMTAVTQTNGQDASLLPITAVPAATIDPDGYFTVPGRMIFARDGTLTLGPSAGSITSIMNLVGVDYSSLTAYNITGDEFSGTPAPNLNVSTPGNFEMFWSPGGNLMWLQGNIASPTGNLDAELFVFDPTVPAPVTQITAMGTGAGGSFDNLKPNATGTQVLASYRETFSSTSDEEVGIGLLSGGFTILTDDLTPGSDIVDGSLHWIDGAAPCQGFFYAQGTTSSSNPLDGKLYAFDLSTNQSTVVDSTVGGYWIFSVGN